MVHWGRAVMEISSTTSTLQVQIYNNDNGASSMPNEDDKNLNTIDNRIARKLASTWVVMATIKVIQPHKLMVVGFGARPMGKKSTKVVELSVTMWRSM